MATSRAAMAYPRSDVAGSSRTVFLKVVYGTSIVVVAVIVPPPCSVAVISDRERARRRIYTLRGRTRGRRVAGRISPAPLVQCVAFADTVAVAVTVPSRGY